MKKIKSIERPAQGEQQQGRIHRMTNPSIGALITDIQRVFWFGENTELVHFHRIKRPKPDEYCNSLQAQNPPRINESRASKQKGDQ